jgi:hypothetical protein
MSNDVYIIILLIWVWSNSLVMVWRLGQIKNILEDIKNGKEGRK